MKKSIKKFISILLIMTMMLSMFTVYASAATGSTADRYSVLVLDVSGSMAGEPIQELKKGAKAFCEQVLGSNRNQNKIAIVTFESSVNLLCDFTDDVNTLVDAIEDIYTGNMTNLAGGLSMAKDLLADVDDLAIKNIVVMCDGLPNQPSWSTGESYAYDVIKTLPLSTNIYGLYFCPNGFDADCEEVMKKVGRNGYHMVTDGSELVFSFIDNGTTITTESVNKTVIHIACPVDVSVTLNGVTLDKNNTRTTFGSLDFEGKENEIKVLTLAYRNDYVIEIIGTGDGTMDYDITYYCNDNQLYTLDYPTVDITPETKITTSVDIDNSGITLDVDEDGDGNVDENISANVSTTNIWYQIEQFFTELFYKIKEFFANFF